MVPLESFQPFGMRAVLDDDQLAALVEIVNVPGAVLAHAVHELRNDGSQGRGETQVVSTILGDRETGRAKLSAAGAHRLEYVSHGIQHNQVQFDVQGFRKTLGQIVLEAFIAKRAGVVGGGAVDRRHAQRSGGPDLFEDRNLR